MSLTPVHAPSGDGPESQEEILDLLLAARSGRDDEPLLGDDEDEPPDWDGWDPQSGPAAAFAANGTLDELAPGAALAGLIDDAYQRGLDRLDDDELVGLMRASRRIASRFAARELAAVADLARRRPAEANDSSFGRRIQDRLRPAGPTGKASADPSGPREATAAASGRGEAPAPTSGPGQAPTGPSETDGDGTPELISPFVPDELAAALTLTVRAADAHCEFALALARRLPKTMAALADGTIDLDRAWIIVNATADLSDEHAAEVEDSVLPRAGGQTTGQLRASVARAVLAADPAAARRRKERAARNARVLRWREDAGTAALCGRDLPSADVLAADQRINARARELKSAGFAGTMDELCARVYMDFLLDRRSRRPKPTSTAGPATGGPAAPGPAPAPGDAPAPGGAAPPGNRASPGNTASPGDAPAPGGAAPPSDPGDPPPPVSLAARINLIVPLSTILGLSDVPGEVTAFGPVDAETARQLATAAGAHPATRWCVTVVDQDGRPVGHGCAHGRHSVPTSPERPDGGHPGIGGGDGSGTTRDGPGGTQVTLSLRTMELMRQLGIRLTPLAVGGCDHRSEERGYKPSRRLRHLIEARTPTCPFPGCRRPAARSDHDHTIPYEAGGRTCECNLAPLCRRHHRCKQSQGWTLEQPSPGIMVWTTPAGREYTTTPACYDA